MLEHAADLAVQSGHGELPARALTLALDVRPRGPYSLALTARFASDATRRFAGGRLAALLPEPAVGVAAARRDGAARGGERGRARAPALRARARRRPLRAPAPVRRRPAARRVAAAPARACACCGCRRSRRRSSARSAGSSSTSREARALERRILRATMPRGPGGLCEPPTARGARRALARCGCGRSAWPSDAPRRSSASAARSTSNGCARCPPRPWPPASTRERTLGPWSAGVVCLQGLGRSERRARRRPGPGEAAFALSAGARSRRGRRRSCSSPTASGPGSRACTCSPASRRGSFRARPARRHAA